MRINRPLLRLPVRFCADRLASEVTALPANAWTAHPQKLEGNAAVVLVSPGGAITDQWAGPMAPTEWLRRCPYIMQIMQELDSTWGRSRLMGLEAGAVVPEHVDVHYYWRTHLRIHVPVITNPKVTFKCDGETVNMKAGECWLLDSFFQHSVENGGEEDRIHLVLDTVGSTRLWDLIDAGAGGAEPRFVGPGDAAANALEFEQINAPAVMSPWEIRCHVDYIFEWMGEDPRLPDIRRALDRFIMGWNGTWARHGTSDSGIPAYVRHLNAVHSALAEVDGPPVMMRNGWPLLDSLKRYVLSNAILPAKLQQMLAAAGHRPKPRMTA